MPTGRRESAARSTRENPGYRVVGVGASAGGLAAFTRLLTALPEKPGVALLLAQHLDPSQHSMLPDILARASRLPVVEATQGTPVEVDHIYVMPANASMRVTNGRIVLQKRASSSGRFLPVDTLLKSLAEVYGHMAVGVVLSGTGSDGVLGLAAVRAAGGLTFAQEPADAEYDGMPRSAVDAGVVDCALRIEDLALELVRVAEVGPAVAAKSSGDAAEEAAYAEILVLVQRSTGLDLSDYRRTTLHRRIARRMLLAGTTPMSAYAEKLRNDPAEVKALYADILVNVTQFFRDPRVLEALKREVFPSIAERHAGHGPIRIWVPGCSKGQEAYSILMLLSEYLDEHGISAEVQMFASDVNEADVSLARAGVYPQGIASEVSAERLARFFDKVPGGYQINTRIREMCVFATHDITRDPPFSRLDLASLRNVLIYMEPRLQQRVMQVLHYAIAPGGFLLLGSSESAGQDALLFAPVDKKNRIYRRKAGVARLNPAPASALRATGVRPLDAASTGRQEFDVFDVADRLVRDQYQLPAMLISGDMEVLRFTGNVGPFMAPAQGPPDFRVTRLLSAGLVTALEGAVRAAGKAHAPARRRGRMTSGDEGKREVEIEAVPISSPEGDEYFMVFFRPESVSAAPSVHGHNRAQAAEGPGEDASLRWELDQTRDQLETVLSERESATADLRAANEKLQASNEELRTINEEFQTAQEELQSTNEELATLNDELRTRNTDLLQISDDLRNVIDGVEIPIIILSSDLSIRRFTPQASTVVNIMPSDVGRPLTDLNLKLESGDLREQALEVIRTGVPSETEVRDLSGNWLSVRVRPYVTLMGEVAGVVVAFIDIGNLKKASEEAHAARRHAEAIVEAVRQPLLSVDTDLTVVEANASFYEAFGLAPETALGRALYELNDGYWNARETREHLERAASSEDVVGFEIDRTLGASGRRITKVTARCVPETGVAPRILLVMEDVTSEVRRQTLTSALNDVSLTLSSSMEFESVVQEVLAESSRALDSESAALLLRRDSEWVLTGAYGLPESVVGTALTDQDLAIALEALKAGEPVLVSDLSRKRRFRTSLGLDPQHRAALLVPILFKGAIIGSMSFHFVRSQPGFTAAEDEFARRLGTMLAFALENAELFAEQRDIAQTLQEALITAPKKIPGLAFRYLYRSATKGASVGGDFFDLFELDRDRVGILIGDVSGKGVRAATLTALTRNSIRTLAYENDSPAMIISKANEVIYKATSTSTFVTLLLCILETTTGHMTYCSAGHTTGLVRRVDGDIEKLESQSPLAGAFDGVAFEDGSITLSVGDTLIVYTDGITEAHRGSELFGEARLIDLLRAHHSVEPKTAPKVILDEVVKFTGGTLSDDVAIVAVALAPER